MTFKGMWTLEYNPSQDIPKYLYVFKNRYSRLIIFSISLFFTTNFVFGWQPLSAMFFKADTYRWNCDALYVEDGPCPAQYASVQTLYLIFVSSQYSCTALGGLLYDNIGPMYTAGIGELTHFLGWILLAYSSQSVQLYIPAMILMGGSVNVVGIPAITLADMFPSHAPVMLGITVAVQGAAFCLPIIMEAIWESHPNWTLKGLMLGYALIFVLPTAILYPLACPYKKIEPTVNEDEAKQKSRSIQITDKAVDRAASKASADTTDNVSNSSADTEDNQPTTNTGSSIDVPNNDTSLVPTNAAPGVADMISESSTIDIINQSIPVEDASDTNKLKAAVITKTDWKLLFTELTSPKWLLFAVAYIFQVMQHTYYPTTVLAQHGETVSKIYGYFVPTFVIWSIIAILPVDLGYINSLTALLINVVMTQTTFIFSFIPLKALQYIGFVIMTLCQSFLYTLKFTYVQASFPPVNCGLLIGLMGTVAGAFSLLNIPLQNVLDYTPLASIYLSLGVVSFTALMYLWWRGRKTQPIDSKIHKTVDLTHDL